MEKVARIFSLFSAPRIYTERSAVTQKSADNHQLIAIVLFSGIGLLVSLVAVIMGMQGSWF
jgi:hypothetical protein